jgi:hypothetical protein
MPQPQPNKSYHFINALRTELEAVGKWTLDDWFPDRNVDLSITDKKTGKRILIDVKDAKEYGELPISSIISIANLARNHAKDQIILVSLSSLSSLLLNRLRELHVRSLQKPSVQEVVQEVEVALAS